MASIYYSQLDYLYSLSLKAIYSFSNYKTKGKEKKNAVASKVPEEWRLPKSFLAEYNEKTEQLVIELINDERVVGAILSPLELELTTKYTNKELLEKVASREISVVDLIAAYNKKAAIANQLTNCCTELLFDYATERAKFLDEHLRSTGKLYGPLHGFPISIKDSFNVPGYDSTVGYIHMIGNHKDPKFTKSPLVTYLEQLGCVIYCKTNIPQTMMTDDSENHIFGRTLNPHNLSWTAGGSSGGAGAIVSLKAGNISIGTDIGGSIRIPSICCGVYGFKPTSLRYPGSHQSSGVREGLPTISVSTGPLSSNLDDTYLLTKSILLMNETHDHEMFNIRWRQEEYDSIVEKPKVRIGVLIQDLEVPLHPPVLRIMNEVSEKLASSGRFELVYIKAHPSYHRALQILFAYFSLEDKDVNTNLNQGFEPPIESVIRYCSYSVTKPLGPPIKTIEDLIKNNLGCLELVEEWSKIFAKEKLDCLLTPSHFLTASPHENFGQPYYNLMWNLCDWPAIVIPYGKVDWNIDGSKPYKVPIGREPYLVDWNVHKEKYKDGVGSFQLICKKYDDEKLLGVAKIVDEIIRES